jgi:hypothetical protein
VSSRTLVGAALVSLLVGVGIATGVILTGSDESGEAESIPTTLAGAPPPTATLTPATATPAPAATATSIPNPTPTLPSPTLTPSQLAALLPPGATVEQVEYAELIPGGDPELVVVYTTDPDPDCAGSPAQARGVNLVVFAAGSGGNHEQVIDGLNWPTFARSLIEPTASYRDREGNKVGPTDPTRSGVFCWAFNEVRFETMHMQPDRDFLVVNKFLHTGVSAGLGRVVLLGYAHDALEVLHEGGLQGPVEVTLAGAELTYRTGLRLKLDANCCPSARREVTVTLDVASGQIAVAQPVILPNATEGTIRAVYNQNGFLSQEAGESIESGSIILAPDGASGPGSIYAVDASTTLDADPAATFRVGDRLRVITWEARNTDADWEGELHALEVESLQ